MSTDNDFEETVVLTTFPLRALAQPLIDFLKANGVPSVTTNDDSSLGLQHPAEVRVATSDEARAKALLADFWAENEADGAEM
jgi:hypothetical protein